MYDELVKRLRYAARWADKGLVIPPHVCLEAADAIEELSRLHEAQRENLITLMNEESEMEWIPVTERLPEPKQKVLVATYLGGVYYGFMEPRGKFYTANNTLADSWCWEPDVTHWMPLPQPPKEEI